MGNTLMHTQVKSISRFFQTQNELHTHWSLFESSTKT